MCPPSSPPRTLGPTPRAHAPLTRPACASAAQAICLRIAGAALEHQQQEPVAPLPSAGDGPSDSRAEARLRARFPYLADPADRAV